jgi:CRISPR-associated protein Csb2
MMINKERPMLTIEMTFPTGRFHATPWGRHVNEGVPEWPPSPYRLIRAVYDAWKRKRPEWPEERVEPLLRAMASSPPRFRLPSASVSHTRSFLSENTTSVADRKLVFDGFVVLSPQSSVLIGWPAVRLDSEATADLDELLRLINFFGRSESWVRAQLVSGIADVEWNCFPVSEAPEGWAFEIARVACAQPADDYEAKPYEIASISGRGRQRKQEVAALPWMQAITWSTNDLLESLRSDPPALQVLPYVRPARCLELSPTRALTKHGSQVNAVLYSLESKVLPQTFTTLEVAERVRVKLMGIHKRVVGDEKLVSPKFSGKDATGKPLTGHRHVYILPFDKDKDGRLDHLLIYCTEAFNQSEVVALDKMNSLWQPDGRPDIHCLPLRLGRLEDIVEKHTRVTSATPFVPPRHYRRGRGEFSDWLIEQVHLECNYHNLPSPIEVKILKDLALNGGRCFRWLEFRRNRKGDASQIGYGFEVEFAKPVLAPFAIGYGCHFGLGLFMSKKQEDENI